MGGLILYKDEVTGEEFYIENVGDKTIKVMGSHEKFVSKKCEQCKKEMVIFGFKSQRKFCSRECLYINSDKVTIGKCPVCGKEFREIPSNGKKQKHCSVECFNKAKPLPELYDGKPCRHGHGTKRYV